MFTIIMFGLLECILGPFYSKTAVIQQPTYMLHPKIPWPFIMVPSLVEILVGVWCNKLSLKSAS